MAGTTHESLSTFGELLHYLRRQVGLTQAELGQAVGYSTAHIGRLEGGQRLPDVLAVKTTFIAALGLEHAPEQAQRLIALAIAAHGGSAGKVSNAQASTDVSGRKLTNLLAPLTSFVGREREMAEVMRLLGAGRLVTLTGAGGVGKTRLALEVGAAFVGASMDGAKHGRKPARMDRQNRVFPDGVWLAEFAPLLDPLLVPRVVASVFGLPEQIGRSYTDALVAYLAHKQVLLILDNCEHLVQACAELTETLLRTCPHLTILATSREPLKVPGEVAWRVPSLTTYEGVRLFAERARATLPDFELGDRTTAAVASICDRLDGIPLALELAAARLRVLTLEQLASRLDDRFALLTNGVRTALLRQQTLRATIAWSYDLLSPPEQTLLRRLSVFVGGWTLAAAEAVSTPDPSAPFPPRVGGTGAPEVLDLLDGLVSKSLVLTYEGTGAGEARYRMLETIRQYAAEQMTACGEEEVARRRHAAYYLSLADGSAPGSLRPAGPPLRYTMGEASMPWLGQLEAEHANLLAALTWSLREGHDVELGVRQAIGLFEFWDAMGSQGEGRDWLECALAHLDPSDRTLERARLLGELADFTGKLVDFAGHIGDHERAIRMGREARAICLEKGAREDLVGVLWVLTDAEVKLNHRSEEQAYGEECLAVARELGDLRHSSIILGYLSGTALGQGDIRRAVELSDEELKIAQRLGDGTCIMLSLYGKAGIASAQKDYDGAAALYHQTLVYCRQIEWNNATAFILHDLGNVALLQGRCAEAQERYQEALKLWHDCGYADVHCVADSFAGLAAAAGSAPRALKLWAAAEAIRVATHSPEFEGIYRERVDSSRAQLDRDAQEAASAAGRAMSIEEAVEFALRES